MRIIKIRDANSAELLSNKRKLGDDIIVFFYAEWCGHCQSMKNDWLNFTKKAPKELNIAECESNHIKKLDYNPNVQGYPTIKYYRGDKEMEEFKDERTTDKLLDFVTKHLVKSPKKRDVPRTQDSPNLNNLITNVETDAGKDEPKEKNNNVLESGIMNKIRTQGKVLNEFLSKPIAVPSGRVERSKSSKRSSKRSSKHSSKRSKSSNKSNKRSSKRRSKRSKSSSRKTIKQPSSKKKTVKKDCPCEELENKQPKPRRGKGRKGRGRKGRGRKGRGKK